MPQIIADCLQHTYNVASVHAVVCYAVLCHAVASPLQVGVLAPEAVATGKLCTGQVGYIITGMKTTKSARVGDTWHLAKQQVEALPGFKPAKSMVFSGQTALLHSVRLRVGLGVPRQEMAFAISVYSSRPGVSTAAVQCGVHWLCGLKMVCNCDSCDLHQKIKYDCNNIVQLSQQIDVVTGMFPVSAVEFITLVVTVVESVVTGISLVNAAEFVTVL